jgi:prevent-host-death family protein
MKAWAVQEAKARFGELLSACESEGPQVVTRGGTEAAVLVPIELWRRLGAAEPPTLKEALSSDDARFDDMGIPPRGGLKSRTVPVD